MRKINSDEAFELNDCKLNFLYTSTLVGGALSRYGNTCKNRRIASIKEYNKSRTGILDVSKNAGDQRCLARVIVAAKFHADFGEKLALMRAGHDQGPSFLMKQWHRLRQGRPLGYQFQQAMRLIVEAKTDPFGPYSLEDAVKFQQVLPSYRLVIFDVQGSVVWSGPMQNDRSVEPKNLYIQYHAQESHFYMVTKPANLLGRERFCPWCLLGYDCRRKEHRCGHSECMHCSQVGCGNRETVDSGYEQYCGDCNRTWKSMGKKLFFCSAFTCIPAILDSRLLQAASARKLRKVHKMRYLSQRYPPRQDRQPQLHGALLPAMSMSPAHRPLLLRAETKK